MRQFTLYVKTFLRQSRRIFLSINSKRLALGFLATVIIASGVIMPVQQASAVTKTSKLSTSEQAKSFAYYRGLRNCMIGGWFKNSTFIGSGPTSVANKNSDMAATDANAFTWFNPQKVITSATVLGNVYPIFVAGENSTTVGVINEPDDGDINCSETDWLKSASILWGYSSGAELLCAIGFTREVSPNACTTIGTGPNNFKLSGNNNPIDNAQLIDKFWTDKLGSSGTGLDSVSDSEYSLYFDSFVARCGVETKGGEYKIQVFDNPATTPIKPHVVEYGPQDRDHGGGYTVKLFQESATTCKSLAGFIDAADDKAVLAYQKYLVRTGGLDKDTTGTGTTPEGAGKTTCAIDGIGWIVCPVLTFLGSIADTSFTFLADNFLSTDPSLVANGSATQNAWSAMRTIANVAFVIAFLIIIFSQLTGLGIANYGIKKLLPRIVIAAILVNISFLICQIAVDLSNVLGYSIKDMFVNLGSFTQTPSSSDASGNAGGWAAIIAIVLIAGVGVLLTVTVPVLLATVIALLMIVLILFARKALIVLLIVIAPIAFVAFLLPNTQNLYKKWQKMFVSLLLVFPIIAAVFGASSLAAGIIKASSPDDNMVQVIAIGVAVVPLFIVPSLLKNSLSAAGALGTTVAGWSSRANKRIGNRVANTSKIADMNKYRIQRRDIRRAQIQSGSYKGKNPLSRGISNLNGRLNSGKISGRYGDQATAKGYAIANEEESKLIGNSDVKLTNMRVGVDGKQDQPLSTGQLIQIVKGQDVTHDGRAGGRVVARASSFNEYDQFAAAQKAGRVANVAEANALLDATTEQNVGGKPMGTTLRKTVFETVGANAGVVSRAPWLGGATIGKGTQGPLSAAQAAIDAVLADKIKPEALAGADGPAVEHLVASVAAMPTGTPKQIDDKNKAVMLLKNALAQLNSPESARLREKITTGGDLDKALQKIETLQGNTGLPPPLF